ncbi:serine hydrolase family protein [Patescibacteria group bacterium]|nr:MAG: serine hydrolase family protein [Patescibacteria group bacterium]
MKRAFLIHGWSGTPEHGWFPWLKRELESRGFAVEAPEMPETDTPRIGTWVPFLATVVGTADEETILVGHSMGCQAILRYLADLSDDQRVGGAYLVAGFLNHLTNADSDEERPIAAEWLRTPLDTERAKRAAGRIEAIFSDNDRYVPLENEVAMRNKLGAKTIILEEMGHFSGDDGVTELPVLLDEILKAQG